MNDDGIISRESIKEFRRKVPEKQSAIWTNDEKAKAVDMYKEGYTITAIAMRLMRSESAIQKQLDNLGVCDACKRYRGENKVRCKCEECELYISGICDGGKLCKKETPAE